MEQKFLHLLQDNHSRLRRICRYYGQGHREDPDLYQEICLQLWRSYQRFRGESLPGTWLYRVAINTAFTYAKKDMRLKKQRISASVVESTDRKSPDKILEHNEQMKELYKAIEGLSKIDQTLILLYLEELSYQEMSEITGLTENNIGVKLNRIKKKLAERITE